MKNFATLNIKTFQLVFISSTRVYNPTLVSKNYGNKTKRRSENIACKKEIFDEKKCYTSRIIKHKDNSPQYMSTS